jgi:hypothetical protein
MRHGNEPPPSKRPAAPGWSQPASGWFERLQKMEKEGDPEADAVARGIAKIPDSFAILDRFFLDIDRNGALPKRDKHPGVPGKVWTFFAKTPSAQKFEKAVDLFRKSGFGVPLVLLASSLPQCYAHPDGARVLLSSGGFASNPRRRIFETAQFVFDVTAPDGFEAHGQGSGPRSMPGPASPSRESPARACAPARGRPRRGRRPSRCARRGRRRPASVPAEPPLGTLAGPRDASRWRAGDCRR